MVQLILYQVPLMYSTVKPAAGLLAQLTEEESVQSEAYRGTQSDS
jgi:hypothetical protein